MNHIPVARFIAKDKSSVHRHWLVFGRDLHPCFSLSITVEEAVLGVELTKPPSGRFVGMFKGCEKRTFSGEVQNHHKKGHAHFGAAFADNWRPKIRKEWGLEGNSGPDQPAVEDD